MSLINKNQEKGGWFEPSTRSSSSRAGEQVPRLLGAGMRELINTEIIVYFTVTP